MQVYNEINILRSSISQKLKGTMPVMLCTVATFILKTLLTSYLMPKSSFI